jgi:hypothetical protein
MAFQAMVKQVRQGKPIPDLYVVPISIKYRYTQPMDKAIEDTLTRLEQALNERQEAAGRGQQAGKMVNRSGEDEETRSDGKAQQYYRLRAIAHRVLEQIEQEYGVIPDLETNWDDRIQHVKRHVLNGCEQQYGLTAGEDERDRERAYRILNAMQGCAEALAAGTVTHDFDWTIDFVRKSIFRLLNFDAIHDGYVAENPTPERFLDTLTRLEREVFNIDQPIPQGHRIAKLTAGQPINLKDHWREFQLNKSVTIARLTQQVQQAVQTQLNQDASFVHLDL